MSYILEQVSKMSNPNDKINELRKNDNIAFRILLKMAVDQNLQWELPAGDPPINHLAADNLDMGLYQETPKLYRFHRGQYPTMPKLRREELFISMLEGLLKEDAALVCAVKDKRVHKLYEGITPALIGQAFPGLLDDIQVITISEPVAEETKKKTQPRVNGKFAKKTVGA